MMATESHKDNVSAFKGLVQHLHEANRIAERDADSVILQYKKFLEEITPIHKSAFLDSSNRVDSL